MSNYSVLQLSTLLERENFHKSCYFAEISKRTDTDLPEKYLIITNNEVVRVRYLLVYARTGGVNAIASRDHTKSKPDSLAALVLNHKFLAIFYFVLLVIIGFSESRYVHYVRQNLSRKFYAGIESIRLLFGK